MKSSKQVSPRVHCNANISTEEANVLFREDSFPLRAVSRLLFGDLGIRYLDRMTATLIKSILDLPYQLDLEANADKIVEMIDQFITDFSKSHVYCPVYVSTKPARCNNAIGSSAVQLCKDAQQMILWHCYNVTIETILQFV
jgi:hypothetical protein